MPELDQLPRPMTSFLAELKRRKVFRVAAVYAATAFVVLQVADLVIEPLGLPAWTMTLVVVLAVLGLPIALVLAWAFELTPDGAERTADAGVVGTATARPQRALRRSTVLRAAGIGAGVVILAAAGWLLLRAFRPEPALAAGNSIAVLPFEVRGSEAVSYLGEGIVDLLSAKLSGAGDIQTVDPRALLGFLSRDRRRPGEDTGREVAERFGARFFVLGSVVEFGGRMQLRASLYEAGARPKLVVEATTDVDADVFHLVDDLAARLLAGRATGAAERLSRLAAVTTDSIDALKAYLSGERAYRSGDFVSATERFQAALRIDSTFALAGYRLAAAAVWLQRRDLIRQGLELAQRHSARLGERERLLVSAHAAEDLEHDYARADSLYRQMLLIYRDEADAWYRLGEVVLHEGRFLGYQRADAREPFERALAIDPDMTTALYHAVNLAAERGDTVGLDTLARRLQRIWADPNDSLFTTVDLIFFHADTARYAWAERQVATTAEPVNVYYANQAARHAVERDPATAKRLMTVLTERAPSAPTRAWAHAGLADIEAARGRLAAAEAELVSAARHDAALALQQRVQLALHPLGEAPPERLRSLRAEVDRWQPRDEPSAQGGTLETVQFSVEGAAVRLYLLGLLDTHLGDLPGARQRAHELRALTPADPDTRNSLAQILEAEIAYREGSAADALRLFMAAPVWRRQPIILETGTLAFAREVFRRAELLREAGRLDDAARAYDIVVDNYLLFYRGAALLRLCQIHADARRADAAREACGRFVALWRDADPGLQSHVEDARRHLERAETGR